MKRESVNYGQRCYYGEKWAPLYNVVFIIKHTLNVAKWPSLELIISSDCCSDLMKIARHIVKSILAGWKLFYHDCEEMELLSDDDEAAGRFPWFIFGARHTLADQSSWDSDGCYCGMVWHLVMETWWRPGYPGSSLHHTIHATGLSTSQILSCNDIITWLLTCQPSQTDKIDKDDNKSINQIKFTVHSMNMNWAVLSSSYFQNYSYHTWL